ncbi:AAA family ATPase [Mycolicibacterium sp. A43C]
MTLFLVCGPPASGKSTWVRERAQPGDITIDYDAIASVLTPSDGVTHEHPVHVGAVTRAARQAAIDTAIGISDHVDVYVIHATPSADLLARYTQLGAEVITIDPGMATVLARAKAERPAKMQGAVKQWYRENVNQRDEPSKIRSSHAWTVTARAYKESCRTHRNDDGTLGRRCWKCDQAIDYDAPRNADSSFETDHYQPLATHPHLAFVRSNFRPSHSACNRSRGAKRPEAEGEWVRPAWT